MPLLQLLDISTWMPASSSGRAVPAVAKSLKPSAFSRRAGSTTCSLARGPC